MKYFIISGEASGDLHGSNLIKSLKIQDDEAELRFWGGDLMLKANGGEGLEQHIKETAFMGFVEVILNLRKIKKLFQKVKKQILEFQPDIVILIDYPGFNLRMAKWLKSKGFKVAYYIVPQVWAWKANRAYILDRYTDIIITILPFEKSFFSDRGIKVEYVGHPLLDALESDHWVNTQVKNLQIAILPGSRKQEIQAMLGIMLNACKELPYNKVKISRANNIPTALYQEIIASCDLSHKKVELHEGKLQQLLIESDVAIVSSGTATLETGIIGTPQVVCYRGNWISYAIARRIVKLKYISLVNLIMDDSIVPELIQGGCNPSSIKAAVLNTHDRSEELVEQYASMRKKLGGSGASSRAAKLISDLTFSSS